MIDAGFCVWYNNFKYLSGGGGKTLFILLLDPIEKEKT